jgi:arsenite methyltransferase
MPAPDVLETLEQRDGVYLATRSSRDSPYARQWEEEAAEDHVRSAIARPLHGEATYEALTAKVSHLWRAFPYGRRYGTVVELGAGYGRVPLYLSRERALECERYVAVDISETMLRRLLEYRERFDSLTGAEVLPVCAPIEALPLPADSVDLILSSAVFLHMPRASVRAALAEAARVLRPGGAFVFDSSFPNRICPANVPSVAAGFARMRRPNRVKYYTRREVETLLSRSGLAAKAGGYEIVPLGHALVPNALAGRRVPGARKLNERLAARGGLGAVTAVTFGARSAAL